MVCKVHRVLGLLLRNDTLKRRVKAKSRDDRAAAVGPNNGRAIDFIHDQLVFGKPLRILTVADTHSRYRPATDVRFS